MSRITKNRKRELKAAVLENAAAKVDTLDWSDVFTATPEEKEYVEAALDTVVTGLREQAQRFRDRAHAVPYDNRVADDHRPGIEEIRSELRRNGIPEELIDAQAKLAWEERNRAKPVGGDV